MIEYKLGNPNSPKFNLFGYTLVVIGVVFLGLSFVNLDALGVGVVGILFGGVVVTSKDGVLIDTDASKLKGYTSFFGYKYGEWENMRNYGSVSVLTSHRVWKVKHLSAKYSDVTPREFVVCLLGKSHRKRQKLRRFDTQQEALSFANEVSRELKLPIERYQPKQLN